MHPRGAAAVTRLLGPFHPLPPGVTPLTGGTFPGAPLMYGVVAVR